MKVVAYLILGVVASAMIFDLIGFLIGDCVSYGVASAASAVWFFGTVAILCLVIALIHDSW